jgi:hypothetical protein
MAQNAVQDAKIYENARSDFFIYSDIYELRADAVRRISNSNFIIVLQILTCTT